MTEDHQQGQPNRSVCVRNTFLHVKDENVEAQKLQHMRRSCSDSSLGSKSPSDKEDDLIPGAGGNSQPTAVGTAGRGQWQLPGGGQLQLPNGLRSQSSDDCVQQPQHLVWRSLSGDDCPQHLVWNNLSSPGRSSGSSDSSLSSPLPNIVRRQHSYCQQVQDDGKSSPDSANQDEGYPSMPGPDRSTWSEGAALHEEAKCKPCSWNWKSMGCSNGASCQFCHMCPKEALKENSVLRKAAMLKKKKAFRLALAAANASADSSVVWQPGLLPAAHPAVQLPSSGPAGLN